MDLECAPEVGHLINSYNTGSLSPFQEVIYNPKMNAASCYCIPPLWQKKGTEALFILILPEHGQDQSHIGTIKIGNNASLLLNMKAESVLDLVLI